MFKARPSPSLRPALPAPIPHCRVRITASRYCRPAVLRPADPCSSLTANNSIAGARDSCMRLAGSNILTHRARCLTSCIELEGQEEALIHPRKLDLSVERDRERRGLSSDQARCPKRKASICKEVAVGAATPCQNLRLAPELWNNRNSRPQSRTPRRHAPRRTHTNATNSSHR